ncbi:Ubiquitin fusion degradation protein 4, partial [Nowakowskiella sp. JEL0078]
MSDLLIHSEEQLRLHQRHEMWQNDPFNANSSYSSELSQGPPSLSNQVAPDAVVNVCTEIPEIGSHANSSIKFPMPPNAETLPSAESSSSSSSIASTQSSQTVPKASNSKKPGASSSKSTKSRKYSLTFKIDGEELSKEVTIFGAIYKHEQKNRASTGWQGFGSSSPNIWQRTYTFTFKKVYTTTDTPIPIQTQIENKISNLHVKLPFQTSLPPSITLDHPAGKILYLLSILHGLNSRWSEIYTETNNIIPAFGAAALAYEDSRTFSESNTISNTTQVTAIISLPPTKFQNNKVTSKFNRQFNEPLVLASNVIPTWCEVLARNFSFLVPFETRLVYLQSTSFGYSRSMSRWHQQAHSGAGAMVGRSSGGRGSVTLESIGRIQRQKVLIARSRLVDSMVQIMELYGSAQSLLEVEFLDEVGTGLGPTLEFFASVSKQIRRKKGVLFGGSIVEMWRDDLPSGEHFENVDEFVGSFVGLFPVPMTEGML